MNLAGWRVQVRAPMHGRFLICCCCPQRRAEVRVKSTPIRYCRRISGLGFFFSYVNLAWLIFSFWHVLQISKQQLQTIKDRFQAFLNGETQIVADEAFINAVQSYYEVRRDKTIFIWIPVLTPIHGWGPIPNKWIVLYQTAENKVLSLFQLTPSVRHQVCEARGLNTQPQGNPYTLVYPIAWLWGRPPFL